MVDAQKLGEGSCGRVGYLACEDRTSEAVVVLMHDLIEERFAKAMGRAVQAKPGGR
jgi:hypothetical protein